MCYCHDDDPPPVSDTEIPESHPRYQSLLTRHRIEEGVEKGIMSRQRPITRGRGEAFDYLLGKWTLPSSDEATRTTAAHLLLADRPVISVDGNVAAPCPGEVVDLAAAVDADIEVNLFSRTDERMRTIATHLRDHGTDEVKGLTGDRWIPGIDHERAKVDADGIGSADVVVVPLEDGNQAEALGAMGKAEIVVGFSPMSRSAQVATVPIVDNIMHAVPSTATHARGLRGSGATREELETIVADFDTDAALGAAERAIHAGDG